MRNIKILPAGMMVLAVAVGVTLVVAYVRPTPTPESPFESITKESPVMMTGSGRQFSKSGYEITPLDTEQIETLAKVLTREQRDILLHSATERAFCGAYYDNKEEGTYVCRLCGLPLFKSGEKYDSGTGWPSFFQPFDPGHIHEEWDESTSIGVRKEIQCARCRSHLGHVFNDGPQPTGLRYCLNSAALKFVKAGEPLPTESRPVKLSTAFFAGGCFWGVEDQFQQIPGVVDAVSGYMGGITVNPDYKVVCGGKTGHAETVRVVFDPSLVSYRDLLVRFFQIHDGTQYHRQGPDTGSQYRSAIFAADDDQLRQAQAYVAELNSTPSLAARKIVTEVSRADVFYKAEDYHQDYHARHGGSCALPTQHD